MRPLISICIPAYKRTGYLKRLLDSIIIQQYKDFEVVISDDTPGDEVQKVYEEYKGKFVIRYFHNDTSLGTPENWNEAVRHATGEWIKIMHDDDWFASNNSLAKFAAALESDSMADFVFSAYNNVYEQENNRTETIRLDRQEESKLRTNTLRLFKKNYIGNPSCTLFRKKEGVLFDNRFKWVVDFEFYMRYLRNSSGRLVYIDEPLVNASLNSSQVTSAVFRDPKIEIPENHLLLEKEGPSILKNILVYDYFWRSYRNLGINDKKQIMQNGFTGSIPLVLEKMIGWQKNIPRNLLLMGPVSKFLMLLHYVLHKSEISATRKL
jgi:glycosyltransferase involved in cell wall biosynthesis